MTCGDIELIEPALTLRVFQLDFRNDSRWEDFLGSHPDALIYHHPDWLAALEEEYGHQCISLACEDERGQLRGVLPLFRTAGLPFRIGRHATGIRLSSLPRTPTAGLLATDTAATQELIHHAIQLTEAHPGTQLEIKNHSPGLSNLVPQLTCVRWRPTYVEELPASTEGEPWVDFWERVRRPRNCTSCRGCRRLRFGNAKQQHRVNWGVNKAARVGLEVREADSEEDLERWYGLYLQTMRHNAVPPRSFRFFLSLWSSMRPKGRLRLLVAEQSANGSRRMVSGSIVFKYGQTVFYAFTGAAPRDLHLHPHDLIQLETIRDACRGGFRWYDMGEVTEDHHELAQFKTKWGAKPQPLYRYYYPAPINASFTDGGRMTSVVRRCWRLLPTKATEILGDVIYRYL